MSETPKEIYDESIAAYNRRTIQVITLLGRFVLTLALILMVWREAGKWTAIAALLLFVGLELVLVRLAKLQQTIMAGFQCQVKMGHAQCRLPLGHSGSHQMVRG
jgi:hypothetical protein